MNKTLLIAGSVAVVAGVGFFLFNRYQKKKFDNSCTSTGGTVIISGSQCDFTNCDKTKYPCNFYG